MTGNDQDDWEVAVDTGEFDKRLEQLGKDRVTTQESIVSSNDKYNRDVSNSNTVQSNKAIRILKRPTHQSQTSTSNDSTSSNVSTATNNVNSNSPCLTNTSTPVVSIIPRNQSKEPITNTLSTLSSKAPIKTYEQREYEYRLARLRIMGEEESSNKDDDPSSLPLDSLQSSPKTNPKASNSSSNINSTESSSQQ
ncbi:unnamed protein product [Adineta ricciae]|uniref:SUZ domain-containing protein n=1 Tax=Adineta ricciae TaxID=249248 RepID=A0A814J8B9_ADIRI|nr:unnamed protein product [Adineta ricciae]CAF1058019.1 unnamed protein product [Adineta ricciae]